MKHAVTLFTAMLLATTVAPPSVAQGTEVHKASKVICTPEKLTRCDEQNKCETTDASARDRGRPLIFDFAAKKAIERRVDGDKSEDREIGIIAEDATAGDVRTVVVRREKADADAPPVMSAKLDGKGKLTGESRRGRQRFEATCKPM